MAALSDAIDRPYRIAALLATFAGLRVGEILALTRERLDIEMNSVLVFEQLQELKRGGYLVGPPKSDAGSRLVSLPDFMMDASCRARETRPGRKAVPRGKGRSLATCGSPASLERGEREGGDGALPFP